jgi:cytochrome c oxidase subunit 2
MDAVPGMPTKFWFVPTKTTYEMQSETGNPEFKYEMACTEICGRGHFAMRYVVVVDEPEDYEAWLAEQKGFASQNPDLVAKFKQTESRQPATQMESAAEAQKTEL